MLYQSNGESRTKLKAVPRKAAVKGGKGRRFQVDLEPRDVLAGDELFAELAKFGFSGEPFRAQMAVLTIERFIVKKLAEGCQIDLLLMASRTWWVVEIKRRREIGAEIIDEVSRKVANLKVRA